MKVTGIIAEYNPFHKGHEYHLKETRRRLNSDYIVVVMSGNYVQRGAPTIIDKYSRAEMALKCGADLVLELPSCFSTASAEYFAFGGVSILDKLNVVDDLCFGTESLDNLNADDEPGKLTEKFNTIAELLINEPDYYKELLKEGLRSGMSTAAAISGAVERILGKEYAAIIDRSNNILAVEYIKALHEIKSTIKAEPVARMLSSHNDTRISESFSSATAIRNAIFNRYDMNALQNNLPDPVYDILMDRYLETFPVFREDFSTMLGTRLVLAKDAEELNRYFGVSMDLANRFINLRNEFKGFNQFRELVNAKNMNKATVGRALMHITLGIKQADMDNIYNKESLKAVKVLGFRERAKPLLSEIKQKADIKLVTKLADYKPEEDGPDMIMQTTEADMLYRMVCMSKFNVDLKTPYEQEIIIIKEGE